MSEVPARIDGSDVVQLLQIGIEKGIDTTTLEKLLELKNKIVEQQQKEAFVQAMCSFQSELPPIEKDRVVMNKDGSVRYRYASYDNIVKTIKPLLSKYGLSYRFETRFEKVQVDSGLKEYIVVTCIVQHVMGHSESTVFQVPVDESPHMSAIQKYGSTLTYAKRYCLSLALGLSTEEDTDAHEDVVPEELATESQKKLLFSICNKLNLSEGMRHKKASEILGRTISSFNELTKREASKLIDALQG